MEMEMAMKWIYQEVKDRNGTALEAGQKPALCFRARKYMLCIAAGYPVRVLKRAVKDFDKARTVMRGKVEHPIPLAVDQFDRIAAKNGITEGARKLLERARTNTNGIDEDQFTDEEGVSTVTTNETPEGASDKPAADTESTTEETTEMKAKKTPKAKKAPRASKKAAKVPKAPKGPSRISRAVEYMREEVKKEGGQKNLERGWRKELFERAAKKFDLSPTTCSIQYGKQVLNGKK